MSEVNVQISVNNVPQFDRHQNDLHRGPMVSQEQNAQIAREEQERRIQMPVQADQAEGKRIDAEENKREGREKKKRRQKLPGDGGVKPVPNLNGPESGQIVDFEA